MRLYLLLVLAALGAACTRPCPPPAALPLLEERRMTQLPDSARVGVLLRLHEPLSEEQRRQLERCGLRVGSVLPGVVTGEAEKRHLGRLAALPFVAYIELPEEVPPPPPPPDPTPDP